MENKKPIQTETQQLKIDNKIRFTFLINPTLLSQIKLISYISNQKLYETINDSISQYINNYNETNNTKIQDIINLNNNSTSPLNPKTK
tara:strand:+ start:2834 stop:3097 length:264 start_codon:yes stop_codon:yes gene_type:complete